MDEVIDELLTKDYSCDIALPRIKKRYGTDYSFGYFPVNLFFKRKLIMYYQNQGIRRNIHYHCLTNSSTWIRSFKSCCSVLSLSLLNVSSVQF